MNNDILSLVTSSLVYKALASVIGTLWASAAGQIFLLTVLVYLTVYLIYGGYFSRFAGGYSLMPFNLSGLTIIDILLLFPTVFVTLVHLVWRGGWAVLKAGGFALLYFLGSMLLGSFLAGVFIWIGLIPSVPLATILHPVGQFLWLAGLYVLLFFLGIFPQHRWLKAIVFLLLLVGTFLVIISLKPLQGQVVVPGVLEVPAPVGYIGRLLWELLIAMGVVLLFIMPMILGFEMAEVAVKEDLLSKVASLTLTQPIPSLGSPDSVFASSTPASSFRQSWWIKPVLSVDVEPDVYTYVPKTGLYLIASFHDSVAFYAPVENRSQPIDGRMILITRNIISSVDFQLNKKRQRDENTMG